MAEPGLLSDDSFLGGALRVLQPARGFRAGVDTVLLASAVPAQPGESALEAGAGTGVASLCLARRAGPLAVTGLEIDAALVALANENAARNGFDSVRFVQGSVAAPPETIGQRVFDHVFVNPPYYEGDEAIGAADPGRLVAHKGPDGTLDLFLDFCLRRAAPKGSVTVIHRADRLDRILSALEGRLGAIAVHPLWPRADAPAKRIIVQGRKGSRAPMSLMPGLVLHDRDGHYTPQAEAILRGGAAFAGA